MLGVRIKVVQVVSGALGTVLKRLRKQSWYWIPPGLTPKKLLFFESIEYRKSAKALNLAKG